MNLTGGIPSTKAHGIWKGDIYTIPTDFRSILSTPLLSWSAKVQFARLMIHLGKLRCRKSSENKPNYMGRK